MLNVNNLHVSYGQSEALHGITFVAKKNETVASWAATGMGKTTLFKSLMAYCRSSREASTLMAKTSPKTRVTSG